MRRACGPHTPTEPGTRRAFFCPRVAACRRLLQPVADRGTVVTEPNTVCYIANTLTGIQMQTWDDRQPIYQQLAGILAAQLLDGEPVEGSAMPSVRALASRYLLNPLTVNRALQTLGDDGVLENRRGLGLFVMAGARERLRAAERDRFLHTEWPRLRERLRRLGISAQQLNWEER